MGRSFFAAVMTFALVGIVCRCTEALNSRGRHLLFRRHLAAAKARGKRLRPTRWHREAHAPSSVVSGLMDAD